MIGGAAQSTNLLLAAGAEAVRGRPAGVPGLAPLRAVKELHRAAADGLGVDEAAHAEVEALLGELQQLLIGIAIMQARSGAWPGEEVDSRHSQCAARTT